MKNIIFLVVFLISNTVFANSLRVDISPKQPVLGEIFKVIFSINTEDTNEPIINFDPLGVEVLSRSNLGVQTTATYSNGKLTKSRILKFSYNMVASRVGTSYLRNVNVMLGASRINHRNINIKVLKEARKPKDFFTIADVSKTDVYVGESILVRYYLYYKNPVRSFDIKKFPVLGKFLKRYHDEKRGSERVNYGGEVYTRRVVYTAQLFAEKPGVYKIDPITLNINYSQSRNRDPFNSFGLGMQFGRLMSSSIRSKDVEINVMPVPAENVPRGYTGLVGHHSFKVKMNRHKFIANEPIELSLEVQGTGALELYEKPELINDASVEEFEVNSELNINKNFSATKKFEYTYLGRESANIENASIPFSYFDPEKKSFITVDISLGDIVIAGNGIVSKKPKKDISKKKDLAKVRDEVVRATSRIEFINKPLGTFIYYSEQLVIIFLLCLLIVIIFFIVRYLFYRKKVNLGVVDEILKCGVNYQLFHKLLTREKENCSMSDKVKRLKLEKKVEEYFLELIAKLNSKYQSNIKTEKIKVNKKYVLLLQKELLRSEVEEDIVGL